MKRAPLRPSGLTFLSALLGLMLVVIVGAVPQTAAALDDPALNYHTITTDHFYVHYYDGLEGLARRTAIAAEESHEILAPLLDWVPAARTHVLVTDKLDTANGFARVFGRNFITIYGMPPQADSVLGYFDDWLRVLMYHEYVHILHLDTNLGWGRWLNRVVGKQYHPNAVLPRWYIEGIAVYLESYRTGSGRVQSPLFRMWLRTAALEDSLFTLGQSTGVPIHWPSGSGAYLYGAFFMDYLVRQNGENYIRDFNHRYGERLIPFALQGITRELTGHTLDEHWEGFTAEALGEATARQVVVEAMGRTPLEMLTDGGGRSRYPVAHPGRGVTFHRSDLTSHPYFETVTASGDRTHRVYDGQAAAGPSAWCPEGETFYFSRSNITRNVYNYQDLFSYRPSTGEFEQLTRGDRAREPAVDPAGERLVHVRNRAGSMELVLRSFEEFEDERVLLGRDDYPHEEDAHWQQISRPVFTPDGESVVFSWWRLDRRQRDLFLVEIESGEIRQLTDSPAHDMDPSFGPDGMLYFTADVDGIFNVHAMDIESGQIWQVSNVLNGVFSPVVSADGRWIYVHTYTYQGFEIARFRHPRRFLHSDRRPAERTRPLIAYPEPRPEGLDSPQPYRPWPWLMPMTLLPEAGIVSGGSGLAATVSGYDPVEHHNYTLSGGVTTGPYFSDPRGNLGLSYRYNGAPVGLNLVGRFQDIPRTQRFVAESRFIPYVERQWLGRVGLSYPLRYLSHRVSLSGSFQVEHMDYRERPEPEHEPGDIRPTEPAMGFFNQVSFAATYAYLFRYPMSISTERGVSVGAGLSLQHPSLGSQENSVTLSYNADFYHPNPVLDRHVFALRVRGAIMRSADRAQRRYTIGGLTPQDVLTSVIFQDSRRGFPLRGYPAGLMQGGQYQVWKMEYRFPIFDFDQGFSTVPLFVRGLKGSLFLDTGTAYDGFLPDARFRTGVGGEMQLDAILGYYASNSLRLGFARGLDPEEGLSEFYLIFGAGF